MRFTDNGQSIFSSQLIHVDDKGRISVIAESWWFVVISLPLTIATFLLWRFWLSHSTKFSDGTGIVQDLPGCETVEMQRVSRSGISWTEAKNCLLALRRKRAGSTNFPARCKLKPLLYLPLVQYIPFEIKTPSFWSYELRRSNERLWRCRALAVAVE